MKIKYYIIFIIIFSVSFTIILQIFYHIYIPKSDYYKKLIEFLADNKIIKEEIGTIIKFKLSIIVPFEYAPNRYTSFELKIYGEKGKGNIKAEFKKRYNEWEINQAVLEIKGKKIFIVKNDP